MMHAAAVAVELFFCAIGVCVVVFVALVLLGVTMRLAFSVLSWLEERFG